MRRYKRKTDRGKVPLATILSQMSGASASSGCAFQTVNGEGMSSGQITRALQSTWRKVNISDQITCTLIRKTAVSAVHQKAPDMIGNLAYLMCHRTETAAKCYCMVYRDKTCIAAAKSLSELTGLSQENTLSSDVIVQETRAFWTENELKALHAAFDEEINAGAISLQSVKLKTKKCRVSANYTARQVYDKVRHEIQQRA